MYDKEYQDMMRESYLDEKTNNVLGVQAAWVIAAFGVAYFIVTLSALISQHYGKITDLTTATIIAAVFVLCALFSMLLIKANRIYSFDIIKDQFEKTGRYWG